MRSCRTRSSVNSRRTRPSANGTRTISADFPASNSCAPCGCATFRAGRSSTRPQGQGAPPSALEEAHRELKISPAEFDEVAAELGRTLDAFKVPQTEKDEVLGAFAAHKAEVTEGYTAEAKTER
jgi:hypothetical protein